MAVPGRVSPEILKPNPAGIVVIKHAVAHPSVAGGLGVTVQAKGSAPQGRRLNAQVIAVGVPKPARTAAIGIAVLAVARRAHQAA